MTKGAKGGATGQTGGGTMSIQPFTGTSSIGGTMPLPSPMASGAIPYQPTTPTGQNPYQVSANMMNSGAGAISKAMGLYTDPRTGMQSDAPSVSSAMTKYYNPYTSQVINQTQQDIDRSRRIQLNNVGGAASSAGAFGGARHGLVEAETNRAALDTAARTSADLRSRMFDTAGQYGAIDVGNILGVRSANQAAEMAKAGGLLSSAGAAAGMGQHAYGIGSDIGQRQMEQGTMSQALRQMLLDSSRGMFEQYTGQPQNLLNLRLASVGANPLVNAGTTNTTTRQPMDWLGLIGNLAKAGGTAAAGGVFGSDIRIKENVAPTGATTPAGVPLYRFNYIGDDQPYIGVIAQELEQTQPDAVIEFDGVKYVDYNKVR